jgi:hypothetical protein
MVAEAKGKIDIIPDPTRYSKLGDPRILLLGRPVQEMGDPYRYDILAYG